MASEGRQRDLCLPRIRSLYRIDFHQSPLQVVCEWKPGGDPRAQADLSVPRWSNADTFAFSTGVIGQNIPPITPLIARIFLKALDTPDVTRSLGHHRRPRRARSS